MQAHGHQLDPRTHAKMLGVVVQASTRRRQRQEDPGDSLAEFVALSQRTWASRLNTGFYRDILILFTHKEVLKRILVLQKKNHYDKPKRTRFSPQPILMLGTERLYPIPVLNPKNIWHK